jgi:hypothetical protein
MYVGKRREGGLPEMGNDQKIVWGGNIYNRGAQGGGVGFDSAARQLPAESARQLALPIIRSRRAGRAES